MKYQIKVPEVVKELNEKHLCFSNNYEELVEIDGAIIDGEYLKYCKFDKEYRYAKNIDYDIIIPEEWLVKLETEEELILRTIDTIQEDIKSINLGMYKIKDLYEKYTYLDNKITKIASLIKSLTQDSCL